MRRVGVLVLVLSMGSCQGSDSVPSGRLATSFEIRTIARLEDSQSFMLDRPLAGVRSSDAYYVVAISSPFSIGRFDHMGRFVGSVGREGEGPEEFKFISTLAVVDDTLSAFDSSRRSEVRFTPDFEVLDSRTLTLPPSDRSVIPMAGGDRILFGRNIERHRVVRRGLDGDLKWVADSLVRGEESYTISATSESSVWYLTYGTTLLKRVDAGTGEFVAEFDIDHPVLSGAWEDVQPREGANSLVPAAVQSIYVDEAGLVWLIARVPEVGGESRNPSDYSRRYDSLIIGFDPAADEIVFEAQEDDYAVFWLGAREFVSYSLGLMGNPVLRIKQVSTIS